MSIEVHIAPAWRIEARRIEPEQGSAGRWMPRHTYRTESAAVACCDFLRGHPDGRHEYRVTMCPPVVPAPGDLFTAIGAGEER